MIPKIQNTTTPSSEDRMIAPNSFSDSMPRSVVVDEHADAGLALPEEEVTDDRADDRQSGGDAEAREDRRASPPEAAACTAA